MCLKQNKQFLHTHTQLTFIKLAYLKIFRMGDIFQAFNKYIITFSFLFKKNLCKSSVRRRMNSFFFIFKFPLYLVMCYPHESK